MGTRDVKLRAIIEAEDRASATFNSIGNSVIRVGDLIKTYLVIQGGRALFEFGKEAIVAGGNLERLKVATEVLAKNMGKSESELKGWITQLEDVNTYGTQAYSVISGLLRTGLMDMTDSLKLTDKTTGETVTGFSAFIKATKELAAASGITSANAIDTLTRAVVTGRGELFDTLGITEDLTQVYKKWASQIGKDTTELTAQDRAMARLNLVMEHGQKLTGTYSATYKTLGKNLLSIQDVWKNLVEIIGTKLQPLLQPLTSDFLYLLKVFRDMFGGVGNLEKDFSKLSGTGQKVANVMIRIKDIFGGLKQVWESAAAGNIGTVVNMEKLRSVVSGGMADRLEKIVLVIADLGKVWKAENKGIVMDFRRLRAILGKDLTNKLVDIIWKIKDFGKAVGEFISAHKDDIITFFVALGAAIGAIAASGTIMLIVNLLMSLVNPITLIILAVGLLAVAWKNNWGGIREKVMPVLMWLWDVLKKMGEWLKANGPTIWEGFKQALMFVWEKALKPFGQWLMDVLPKAWEIVLQVIEYLRPSFEALGQAIWDLVLKLIEMWKANKDWIIPMFQTVAAIVGAVLVVAIKVLVDVITWLVNAITNYLLPAFQWVIDMIRNYLVPAFQAYIDFMMTVLTPAIEWFKENWSNIWKVISAVFSNIWEYIKMVVKVAWAAIETYIKIGWTVIKGIFQTASRILKGDWKGAWDSIKETFLKVWDLMKEGAQKGIDAIIGFFKGLPQRIGDALSGLGGILKNALKNSIKNMPGVGDQLIDLLGFAGGTTFAPGGIAKVHKDEIIALPRGSRVYSKPQAEAMQSDNRITGNIEININGAQNPMEIARQIEAILARRNQSALLGLNPAFG